jgi:hypothetical protein
MIYQGPRHFLLAASEHFVAAHVALSWAALLFRKVRHAEAAQKLSCLPRATVPKRLYSG